MPFLGHFKPWLNDLKVALKFCVLFAKIVKERKRRKTKDRGRQQLLHFI